MIPTLSRIVPLLTLLTHPLVAFALPGDTSLAMQIHADTTLMNYKTGVNTYEGNVRIDQGTTHLLADRLVTKSNEHHKLEEAIAYGTKKLAEYTTLPRQGDKLFHAQANIIRFYPPKSTVVLEKNVLITQGENSFHGAMIIYNMKDQIVTAPATKYGHATIMIEPKQLK